MDKRILIVVGLIILIVLMMDFNNRMNELTRLNSQRDALYTEEAQLASTQNYLNTQIAYATSDLAVQDYARNSGKMVQPGDKPLVPIAPAGSTVQPTVMPTLVAQQIENWQKWYELFFGQ
jgi:hypothetical protein